MQQQLPLIVLLLVALTYSPVHGQECQTFQSLNSPTPAPELTRCGADAYKASSCCTRASAKRAYNWVYDDDGCGIVGYGCAVEMANLACAVNCGTNLIVSGYNYNNSRPVLPGKVVVNASYAKRMWTQCQGYAWCGTQQQFTTDCKFLAVSISAKGKSTSASLQIKTAADTCTLVADLNPVSFAENILGLVVDDGDTPGFFSNVEIVPYQGTGGASSMYTISTLLIVSLISLSLTFMNW